MRVVRVLLGVMAILVALPLLLGGLVLWAGMQHRTPDGGYRATLAPLRTDGYAVLVPDVDALLRRDAPFARGKDTGLHVTARSDAGPVFVGLAPLPAVERYLADVPHATVTEVRLTRGRLPVNLMPVAGPGQPAGTPSGQPFWLQASVNGDLSWAPSTLRGQQLALVIMNGGGQPAVRVTATAEVTPGWLDPTAWGLLVLGTVALLLSMVLLFWPRRQREIVYVVEPSQVPVVAARLGASTGPLRAAIGAAEAPLDPVQPAGPAAASLAEPAGSVVAPVVAPAGSPAEPAGSVAVPVVAPAGSPAEPAGSVVAPVVAPAGSSAEPAGPAAGPAPAIQPPAGLVERDTAPVPAIQPPGGLVDPHTAPAPARASAPVPAQPTGPAPPPGVTGTCPSSPVPPITPSFVWPPVPPAGPPPAAPPGDVPRDSLERTR